MSVFNSLGSNYGPTSKAYSLKSPAKSAWTMEEYLHKKYRTKKVFLTYKGREAIALILKNLALPNGSLVAINGYTCYAVYQATVAAGLRPYYLDLPENGLNFTAPTLRHAVINEPDIKAVIVQNTLGMACDITAIKKVCNQNKLFLIEDLAHSIGLQHLGGQEAGTVGQAAALSFSQDKSVDSVTGGAALFNFPVEPKVEYQPANAWHRFATRLYPWTTRLIRSTFSLGLGRVLLKAFKLTRLLPGPMSGGADHIHALPNWHSFVAYNGYQMLAGLNLHRQKIAEIYRQSLPSSVQFDHVDGSIYLRFPIRVNDPAGLISYLKQYGIYLADRWYDAPVAPARSLKLTNYQKGQCPVAERVASQMVNLPTHVNINEEQARILTEKVTQWLK